MSGISLCRMTKRSNAPDKVSHVCWHCLFVTWTWLILWCWFCYFVQLLYCYFQQLVTRWPVCVCVCVCSHCLERGGASLAFRPSSSRSGAPVTSGDWGHPTFLFVLRLEDTEPQTSHKHKQINVQEMYVYFAFYICFFLMYEHSDCIWND